MNQVSRTYGNHGTLIDMPFFHLDIMSRTLGETYEIDSVEEKALESLIN